MQFTRGKSFDTFCPCGPWIETEASLEDLRVRTLVNDTVVQEGHTRDMIWSIPELLRFITGIMTLEPGDLLLTGTPEGVGPLNAGEAVVRRREGRRYPAQSSGESRLAPGQSRGVFPSRKRPPYTPTHPIANGPGHRPSEAP